MTDEPEILKPEVDPLKDSRRKALKKRRITERDNKIMQLKAEGWSNNRVAKVADCHPSTVKNVMEKFKGFFADVDLAENYPNVRQKLLNASELRLLRSVVDEEAITKAPLGQRAFALDKVHNMRRLDANLSTANVSSKVTHTELLPLNIDKYKK